MKSLKDYIVESKQTFTYRVKYAGDFNAEKQELMKEVFAKFDVESISAIKKAPVMKSPYDFPELENEEVSSYDVVLNYPASASQIIELARAKGCDINRLKIMDKRFADSVAAEEAVEQPEVLLLHFEDFITQRDKAIQCVFEHAIERGFQTMVPTQDAINALAQNIDPKRSPTFRSGKVGGWKNSFTEEHKRIFKDTTGDLLIRLGYEDNYDW